MATVAIGGVRCRGGDLVLDVGPSSTAAREEGDADLTVFVDRIAAMASDPATRAATATIRRAIRAGDSLPGLSRLVEGLTESVAAVPPPQRHPGEDSASVVAAVRGESLVVLDGFDVAELAESVAALVADGRRVVVTASTHAAVQAVRAALPAEAVGHAIQRLPALNPAEVRELRRLLATATSARRARIEQQVPEHEAFPSLEVARALCAAAVPGDGANDPLSARLTTLPAERVEDLVAGARRVMESLAGLQPRDEWAWAWALLDDLIHNRRRAAFDRLVAATATAVESMVRSRDAVPAEIVGSLPPDTLDQLHRYHDFLAGGGRVRTYFRSPQQREVAPVLDLLRVDGRVPADREDVRRAIEYLELGQCLAAVDGECGELGVEPPFGEEDLLALESGLIRVADALESIGALRHDVLFLSEDTALDVPDAESAQRCAEEILAFAETGAAVVAAQDLDRTADELAGLVPEAGRSPEHDAAVAALRARDVEAYDEALGALAAARREAVDAAREVDLLGKLAGRTPTLARAWRESAEGQRAGLGFACFRTIGEVLRAVPPADSADVVVVAGAPELGVERLLLAAVAPRLVAVVAPDDEPEVAPGLLTVLRRVSALVIRSGRPESANARVMPLAKPGRTVGRLVAQQRVGQAGA